MGVFSEVSSAVCACPGRAVSALLAELEEGCCGCMKESISDHVDVCFGKTLEGCIC